MLPANVFMRDRILALQEEVMAQEQVEIPIRHYFAKGLYAREMFVPKGIVFVGKIHKTEHICVCSMGDFTIVSEFGKERVTAPMTIVSQPGTKRCGYAHVDSVWTNFHATDKTDIDEIEEELVTDTYAGLTDERLVQMALESIGDI